MLDPTFLGLWSADIMYGPGAQSDTMLIFHEDGTGWMEELNFSLCSAEFFRWNVPEAGRLLLHGYRHLQVNRDDTSFDEEQPLWPELNTPFQMQMEKTPSGKTMKVLRLQLYPNLPNQWDAFGLDTESVLKVREPPQAGPIKRRSSPLP